MERNRIRDFGIVPGRLETGKRNKITDVPGVKVGHCTVKTEENHTGITVIVPGADNAFAQKYTAAAYVHNGCFQGTKLFHLYQAGALAKPIMDIGSSRVLLEELGTLETPIALTNTLNVGKVWDAMVDIVVEQCEQDGLEPMSINPVVGECNDSRINQIQKRVVGADEVRQAFASASEEFEEGDVGAGAGTICYGLKGGIGSASRVIRIGEKEYTIGVLVQSNFGATEDFVLNGESVGAKILDWKQEKDDMAASEEDKGSIMSILATDLPLTSRQLRRILRRTGVGIARTGGYTGHGSGEVMIGFTTANRIPSGAEEELLQIQAIPEHVINRAFLAAAEAEQEAILNSMTAAERTRGQAGELYYSLSEYLEDQDSKQ